MWILTSTSIPGCVVAEAAHVFGELAPPPAVIACTGNDTGRIPQQQQIGKNCVVLTGVVVLPIVAAWIKKVSAHVNMQRRIDVEVVPGHDGAGEIPLDRELGRDRGHLARIGRHKNWCVWMADLFGALECPPYVLLVLIEAGVLHSQMHRRVYFCPTNPSSCLVLSTMDCTSGTG